MFQAFYLIHGHLALLPLPGQIRALLNTDGWSWATFYGRRETDAPKHNMRKEWICNVDNDNDTMTQRHSDNYSHVDNEEAPCDVEHHHVRLPLVGSLAAHLASAVRRVKYLRNILKYLRKVGAGWIICDHNLSGKAE